MIILITGTPGTGKSTIAVRLSKKIGVQLISINKIADSCTIGIDRGGSKIVDIERLSRKIKHMSEKNAIIEGHLAHLLNFGDVVIVLRANPKILKKRLNKKGFGKKKIEENLEAEALDVCLVESLEKHRNVYEVDTSGKRQSEVLAEMISILKGDVNNHKPGKIDWSEEYFDRKLAHRIPLGNSLLTSSEVEASLCKKVVRKTCALPDPIGTIRRNNIVIHKKFKKALDGIKKRSKLTVVYLKNKSVALCTAKVVKVTDNVVTIRNLKVSGKVLDLKPHVRILDPIYSA